MNYCPVGWAGREGKDGSVQYFHISRPAEMFRRVPPSKKRRRDETSAGKMRSEERTASSRDAQHKRMKRSIPGPLANYVRERDGAFSLTTVEARRLETNDNVAVKDEVLNLVKRGFIKFPYKRMYFADEASNMFANLRRLAMRLKTKDEVDRYFHDEMHSPHGVRMRCNVSSGRRSEPFFPYTFQLDRTRRPRYFVHVENDSEYWDVQLLTDMYSEEMRMTARRNHQSISIREAFLRDTSFQRKVVEAAFRYRATKPIEKRFATIAAQSLARNKTTTADSFVGGGINSFTMRESVWHCRKTHAECTTFKVALAASVLRLLRARRVLDISAGWGDRLIANLACDVERYVATDPNTSLKPAHDRIVADVKQQFACDTRTNVSILYEPFESAALPAGEMFDTVFTSPPFFDFEIYVPKENRSDAARQSISGRNTFVQWMSGWFFPTLEKAWSRLSDGGHMAIHITDTWTGKGQKCEVCEPMCLFMQWCLPGARYAGCVQSMGYVKKSRPIWVFRKLFGESVDRSRRARSMLESDFGEAFRCYGSTSRIAGMRIEPLRGCHRQDIESITRDQEVMLWVGNGKPWPKHKVDKIFKWCEDDIRENPLTRTHFYWAIYPSISSGLSMDRPIGLVAVHQVQYDRSPSDLPKYFLTIFLARRTQRKGLGTHAARMCMQAFRALRRDIPCIFADVHAGNEASSKMLTKLGFVKRPEGIEIQGTKCDRWCLSSSGFF